MSPPWTCDADMPTSQDKCMHIILNIILYAIWWQNNTYYKNLHLSIGQNVKPTHLHITHREHIVESFNPIAHPHYTLLLSHCPSPLSPPFPTPFPTPFPPLSLPLSLPLPSEQIAKPFMFYSIMPHHVTFMT